MDKHEMVQDYMTYLAINVLNEEKLVWLLHGTEEITTKWVLLGDIPVLKPGVEGPWQYCEEV